MARYVSRPASRCPSLRDAPPDIASDAPGIERCCPALANVAAHSRAPMRPMVFFASPTAYGCAPPHGARVMPAPLRQWGNPYGVDFCCHLWDIVRVDRHCPVDATTALPMGAPPMARLARRRGAVRARQGHASRVLGRPRNGGLDSHHDPCHSARVDT
jgi:hypothetical protein